MPSKTEKQAAAKLLAAKHADVFLEQRYVPALPIDDVEEHPANPNEGDVGALHELIDANGFYGAILVQEKTPEGERRMRIVAGNTRHRAMKQKGRKVIPAFLCTMDDERAARIMLGDNKSRDRASTNDDTLARLLQTLNGSTGTLRGTGYDTDDLQETLKRLQYREPKKKTEASPYTKPAKAKAETWPVIQVRVPPQLLERFTAQMELCTRDEPWEKLDSLVQILEYHQTASDSDIT